MTQPDSPRPGYGQQRTCSNCGTRVAQKAQTCFFCGAVLDLAPRRRLRVPWADIVLFAAIGVVLVTWWLRAPETPDALGTSTLQAAVAPVGTASLLAALVPEEPLPTPTPRPTDTPYPTPTATPAPTSTPPPTPSTPTGPIRHTVARGDTVSAIAEKYKSNIKDIIQANNLPANGRLSVGQELIIPVSGPSGGPGPANTPAPTPTGNPGVIYTVKSGDTLGSIAQRFGSNVEWIRSANNLKPEDILRIGMSLLVPGSAATPTPTVTAVIDPLTPSPTPEPGLGAPALLAPADGTILTGEGAVLLSWTSVAVLKADEWYVVTLFSNESEVPTATHWTRSTTWRLPDEYRPKGLAGIDYSWRVQVRVGSRENPGEQVSPPSVERRFTWR